MKLRWNELGGQIGIGLAVAGVFFIFLGWNGAASYDRVPSQFPYLISGGVLGLALVVLGGAVLIVQNARQDRAELQQGIAELRDAIERLTAMTAVGANGSAGRTAASARNEEQGLVVAGGSSYHRVTCRLIEGRGVLPTMTVEAAEAAGLAPCRACDAADLALPVAEREPTTGRKRRRA